MVEQGARQGAAVAKELGIKNYVLEEYESREAAEAAASSLWASWIIFQRADPALFHPDTYRLEEVCKGGVGFGHRVLRMKVPELFAEGQRRQAYERRQRMAQHDLPARLSSAGVPVPVD